jgi:two-component system sensor histidine kinase GlrK
MTGYLAVLVLAMAVSAFAVMKLRQLRDVTESIIVVDNKLLDLYKNLSDNLLSEQRYEKKYFIIHDKALYERFLSSSSEFVKYYQDALRIAEPGELRSAVDSTGRLHAEYQALVNKEAGRLPSKDRYVSSEYRRRKEKIINDLIGQIIKVRSLSQRRVVDKVKQLSDAGSRATKVAMAATAVAIAAGIAISILLTTGITRPLHEMEKKMAEFSNGMKEVVLDVNSPPEIASLARSFTLMCGKLQELDRMKTEFYALMSHELRTPLTSIKESTSLCLEGVGGALTEKQKRLLTIIAEESNRLIERVSTLLDLSKIEAGMASYTFSDKCLNALIVQALAEAGPVAESRRIRIARELRPVPGVSVDEGKILQVLRNLIGNALKFTPPGGLITVSSRRVKNGVSVSVSDTGPGISPEQLLPIFEKYRQAGGENTRTLQGTGLGLAIVKHIILEHGGRVWAESDGKSGSTFTFVLPLC